MTNKNTGGPAFPIQHGVRPEWDKYSGMTLRDYFAAKAMQGICASGPGLHMTNDRISAEAYEIADCMLKAREV